MKRIVMMFLMMGAYVGVTPADTGDGYYESCDVCYSSHHKTGSDACSYQCQNCGSQWHRTESYSCPKKVSSAPVPSTVPQDVCTTQQQSSEAAQPQRLRSKDIIKKWKRLTCAEHIRINGDEFRAILNNFRTYRFKDAIVIGELFTVYCCQIEKALVIREAGKRSFKKLSRISTTLVEISNCMYAVREAYIYIDGDDTEVFDNIGLLKLLAKRIARLEKLCSKRRRRVKKDSCVAVERLPSSALNFCAE
jgi:hypothetical protein